MPELYMPHFPHSHVCTRMLASVIVDDMIIAFSHIEGIFYMVYSLSWLADVLRKAGCAVVEEPGWKTAGRGEMGPVKGVILHHTAGPKTGNAPSLGIVQHGRPDLPGPLSQLFLARDGTFHVIGAGRCNHAGKGSWKGLVTGNTNCIGIEAENMGTSADPWPEVQYAAYVKGVAAILQHCGLTSDWAIGHKEYALPKGRKIDPSFDMDDFRDAVSDAMSSKLVTKAPVSDNGAKAMLQFGDHGESVTELQTALGIHADGSFGIATKAAVMALQKKNGLTQDGLVGPKTWALLGEQSPDDN